MKLRICRLLAIAAFVSCFLASAQTLAQNAYITNQGDNNVSVIATATNTVTATINEPIFSNPGGVAVTPDGSTVYVANGQANNVAVIDTGTNTITAVAKDAAGNTTPGSGSLVVKTTAP